MKIPAAELRPGSRERPEKEKTTQTDDSEAQEALVFDELFDVDRQRDLEEIKNMMRRLRKDSKNGRMSSQSGVSRDKSLNQLKYSDEQIAAGEWERDDYDFVCAEVRKDKMDIYFSEIAKKYEPGQDQSPIALYASIRKRPLHRRCWMINLS